MPRFILARPARSQPLARPTMAPAQIWRRVSFPQPSLNVPRHAKTDECRAPSVQSSESASSPGLEILLELRKRHLGRMFAQICRATAFPPASRAAEEEHVGDGLVAAGAPHREARAEAGGPDSARLRRRVVLARFVELAAASDGTRLAPPRAVGLTRGEVPPPPARGHDVRGRARGGRYRGGRARWRGARARGDASARRRAGGRGG